VIFNYGFLILDFLAVAGRAFVRMYECGFEVEALGRGGISEAASLVIENPAIYVAAFADLA